MNFQVITRSLIGLGFVIISVPASAQTEGKITASDAAFNDEFGYSVSVDGDTAVIGAFGNDDAGTLSGSAYVYSRNDGGTNRWGEVAKLTASDASAQDWFGWSVSVSGDTVVVGARNDDDGGTDSGSAYVYSRNMGGTDNWGEVTKLTASDASSDDQFGISVSVDGDTIVIGAWRDESFQGAAYVYSRDMGGAGNWGEVTKLSASDGAMGDIFGWSVSVSLDTVVVGAYGDNDWGPQSGSAYVFARNLGGVNNWGEITKLTASDAEPFDDFGRSVSVDGETAVIGAYGNDDSGENSGSAYVFARDHGGANNWGEVAKLTAFDAEADDYFALSVSVSGGTVVVGAYGDDDSGPQSGSSYVYLRNRGGPNNWGEATKLTPSDAAATDLFGTSVAVSGDTAIIGAINDDHTVFDEGSAYVFFGDPIGVINSGPTAVDDTYQVVEDTPFQATDADGLGNENPNDDGLIANDNDLEEDVLALSSTTAPFLGSLGGVIDATDDMSGNFDYFPASDVSGVSETFSYEITDGEFTGTATVTLVIAPVNDPPTFVPGPDVIVDMDSGPYNEPWASSITPGPPNEAGQTVSFDVQIVGATNSLSFDLEPAIDPIGRLTFSPSHGTAGVATVRVILFDDGGGTNSSAPFELTIDVSDVIFSHGFGQN